MKYLKQLLLLIIMVVFTACEKDTYDNVGPEIDITNIKDNAVYNFGQTIVMKFNFKDESGIYEYKYEIYGEPTTKDSFMEEHHYTLNAFYTNLQEAKSILLPAKSDNETYQEGKYIIKVTAADINDNISVYYKPIQIVYPTKE